MNIEKACLTSQSLIVQTKILKYSVHYNVRPSRYEAGTSPVFDMFSEIKIINALRK